MATRVLLAEDEPHIAETLTFLLEHAGYEVAAANNGKQALRRALAEPPDVMVLDMILPELDGYEILQQLRADERGRTVPVLMLTAKGQRVDRETALEYGADMFMTKPFSNAEITAAIARLAERRSTATPE